MTNFITQTVNTIKNWWLFLLTGILMVAGSIWVMFTPAESYITLSLLFSIIILANGISHLIFSISNAKSLKGWGWYLAGGIFEIIVGIVLMLYPGISIVTLPLIVAFWLMFRGFQIIGISLELKENGILNWGWFLLLGSALSVMSFVMLIFPVFGPSTVVYLTSVAMMIFGVTSIMFSISLKKIKSQTIDKVSELKKTVLGNLKDLKNEILDGLNDEKVSDPEKVISNALVDFETKSFTDNK